MLAQSIPSAMPNDRSGLGTLIKLVLKGIAFHARPRVLEAWTCAKKKHRLYSPFRSTIFVRI